MIDQQLENAVRASWSASTAPADVSWDAENPAAGHCDVTSLVIREHLGGDLRLAQVFRDGVLSEHHYWNLLPDGTAVDLTSEQFDGTETIETIATMDSDFFAQAGPVKPELQRRLDLFRASVDDHLRRAIEGEGS